MDLRTVAFSAAAPLFGVVDGGRFDDAPRLLRAAGLSPRALFIGIEDSSAEAAGPWLAPADTMREVEALLAFDAQQPASFVLWSCPAGENALYRHLRGLNEAVVELWREEIEPAGRDPRRRDHRREERALFRHWDPRVLTLVLPVLDESQFARVLGPASQVALPGEDGVARVAGSLDPSVVAARGPLRLSLEQTEALGRAMTEASRRRIAAYLFDAAPDHCAVLGAEGVSRLVAGSERSARAFGVEGEYARGLWAFMRLTSAGDFWTDPAVERLMRGRYAATPEERVEKLFDARLAAIKGAR